MTDTSDKKFEKATIDILIQKCYDAAKLAHAPYSKFPVGASLLCKDGSIYTGCNVENAAYTLSTCAERTAIVKAVSDGKKEFEAIVVCALNHSNYISPCGGCRQVLSEFGLDFDVYLCKTPTDYKQLKVSDLLPFSFQFDNKE